MRWLWPLTVCLLIACAPREVVDLVDHAAWELVPDAEDPFVDERPPGVTCEAGGFGHEAPVFEVETELCDWGTFRQPLLDEILPGETLRMVAWHLPLFSDDGGEGLLSIQVGGEVLEYRTDIPAEETVLRPELRASAHVEAGSEVLFHVHNHGANSWRLLELRTGPAGWTEAP